MDRTKRIAAVVERLEEVEEAEFHRLISIILNAATAQLPASSPAIISQSKVRRGGGGPRDKWAMTMFERAYGRGRPPFSLEDLMEYAGQLGHPFKHAGELRTYLKKSRKAFREHVDGMWSLWKGSPPSSDNGNEETASSL